MMTTYLASEPNVQTWGYGPTPEAARINARLRVEETAREMDDGPAFENEDPDVWEASLQIATLSGPKEVVKNILRELGL